MNQLAKFLFAPMTERDGTVLPFSRMDVVLVSLLALCFMFLSAFFSLGVHDLDWTKIATGLFIATLILLMTPRRRLVLTGALGILSIRLIFGLLFVAHTAQMFIVTFACCGLTLALGKGT